MKKEDWANDILKRLRAEKFKHLSSLEDVLSVIDTQVAQVRIHVAAGDLTWASAEVEELSASCLQASHRLYQARAATMWESPLVQAGSEKEKA